MASRWFYRNNADVTGPVSFNDLVGLVVAGTLEHRSEVRRDGADEWQSLDTVIGLAKAVERWRGADANHGRPSPILSRDTCAEREDLVRVIEGNETARIAAHAGRFDRRLRKGPVSLPRAGLVSALIACIGLGGCWLWSRASRFPKPAHIKADPNEWWCPVIGDVSGFEFAVLCFDVLAVAAFAAWWFRSGPNRRHAGN